MQPADNETPRFPLSRCRILRAALRLADAEGLDAVSMRRLAAALDVTPRALYRYVTDKDDLLHGVGDAVLGELRPSPPQPQPWTATVTWVLAELRRVLTAHPKMVPLVAARAAGSPAMVRVAEGVVSALRQAGCDDQTSIRSFHALLDYVLGFVVEAGRSAPSRAHIEPLGHAAAERDAVLDPGEHAHVTAVTPAPPTFVAELELRSDAQFTYGLQLLVGALEQRLASANQTST